MSESFEHALTRSAELDAELADLLKLGLFENSLRFTASRILCSVSLEHAESIKLLLVTGNFTSAVGLLRLQFEALVRAAWLFYAASEKSVSKQAAELTEGNVKRAARLPMLSEMLKDLEGKMPEVPLSMLREFKAYSWKPLSSFIHGGIHAINRHSKGYPPPLLQQALRASNGVSFMVGNFLVILSGNAAQRDNVTQLQRTFSDCLPPLRPSSDPESE